MADKFLLLVEGKDDFHVMMQLLEHHRVPETFRVKDKQGIDNLLETLDVELLEGSLECLGIIVDADVATAFRWDSINECTGTVRLCRRTCLANPNGHNR